MIGKPKPPEQAASSYRKPRCPVCNQVLVPDPGLSRGVLVHGGERCKGGRWFIGVSEARYDSLADLAEE